MAAQAPVTTIPPFQDQARLPGCATLCGPLYDANGACVPPAAPQADAGVYTSCFCSYAKLAPFSQGPSGVCDQACTANEAGLQSIASWFQGICKAQNDTPANRPNAGSGNGNNPTIDKGASDVTAAPANAGGGDWLSHHWQWVIMLVILVVGIAGIWIGACVWRRRYLRNKDQMLLNQTQPGAAASNPSWGPAIAGSESATPMAFIADSERSYAEGSKSKEKLKWTVTQRT